MRVIPPFPILSVAAWTCNIVENETIWLSGTTYTIGQRVKFNTAAGLDSTRYQYESLQNGNLNHSPDSSPTWWRFVAVQYQPYDVAVTYFLGAIVTDSITHENYQSLIGSNLGNPLTDTTKWMSIGPTNTTAAFDLGRSTRTVANVPIVYTIRPNQSYNMNSLALFGLWATSVNIKINNFATPGVYFFNRTLTLTPTYADWLAYGIWATGLSGPIYKEAVAVFDLTPGTDVVITITITNTELTGQGNLYGTFNNDVTLTKCGAIVLGEYVDLGGAEYGAINDVINFSTVNRAFDGSTDSIVRRRNIPRNTYNTYAPATSLNMLYKLRNTMNAAVCAWIGITDYTATQFDSLAVLGFYKRFSIVVDQQDRVRLDLEIEEV